MSGVALIGAILGVLILNVLPSVLPFQLTGNLHLLWVLFSLFAGILIFKGLQE